jgi:hypothetical protein
MSCLPVALAERRTIAADLSVLPLVITAVKRSGAIRAGFRCSDYGYESGVVCGFACHP